MVATAVAGLALVVPAAEAARLDSDPLTVEVDAWGATNAYTADGRVVFDGGWSGLRVRLSGGEVVSPDTSVAASGPVVRDGDELRQLTSYRIGPLAVEQTTAVRDGDVGYRVRWELRNTSGAPVAFRLGAVGRPGGSAAWTATFERSPTRFLGTREQSTGVVRGFAEVPEDPWSSWRHGFHHSVENWFANDLDGGGWAASSDDASTGVAWDDHVADALAPGATAVHAVRFEVQHGPRISLASPARAIFGSRPVLRAEARDASGAPIKGAALRVIDWGATRAASPALTTGDDGGAELPVTGERVGSGHVAVWLDQDGDGRLGAAEPRAVHEMTWVPRLPISAPGRSWTGMVREVEAVLYDEDASPMRPMLRWRVEGAHPGEAAFRPPEGGEGVLRIAGTREGEDRVSVFADLDEDGVRDDGEPAAETTVTWRRPGPGLQLLADGTTLPAGSDARLSVALRDAGDRPVSLAHMRWWSTGANHDGLSFGLVGGSETWTWLGREAGPSTVNVAQDVDDDGEIEAGEPRASLDVLWQAPPRAEPPEGTQLLPTFSEAPSRPADAAPQEPAEEQTSQGTTSASAPGDVPAPAAPAPAVVAGSSTPALARIGRVAPAGRSGLRVALRCPRTAATACGGRVAVRNRTGRRRLGSARFRVAPGAARTVRVALRARPRLVRVSAGAGRAVLRRVSR